MHNVGETVHTVGETIHPSINKILRLFHTLSVFLTQFSWFAEVLHSFVTPQHFEYVPVSIVMILVYRQKMETITSATSMLV